MEQRLFGEGVQSAVREISLRSFPCIDGELRLHRHVTLQLLWREYKQVHPDGY